MAANAPCVRRKNGARGSPPRRHAGSAGEALAAFESDRAASGSRHHFVADVMARGQTAVARLSAAVVHRVCRTSADDTTFISLPDEGVELGLNGLALHAVPAHYLHPSGNFQFYDPAAETLFSGDVVRRSAAV